MESLNTFNGVLYQIHYIVDCNRTLSGGLWASPVA